VDVRCAFGLPHEYCSLKLKRRKHYEHSEHIRKCNSQIPASLFRSLGDFPCGSVSGLPRFFHPNTRRDVTDTGHLQRGAGIDVLHASCARAAWTFSHADTGYHFRFVDDEYDLDRQRASVAHEAAGTVVWTDEREEGHYAKQIFGRPEGFCTHGFFAGADDGIRTELRPLLYPSGWVGLSNDTRIKERHFRSGCAADVDLRWHHLDGL
jgi:hypothetical protein